MAQSHRQKLARSDSMINTGMCPFTLGKNLLILVSRLTTETYLSGAGAAVAAKPCGFFCVRLERLNMLHKSLLSLISHYNKNHY